MKVTHVTKTTMVAAMIAVLGLAGTAAHAQGGFPGQRPRAAAEQWHYAYFPTRAQADQYAEKLRRNGQTPRVSLDRTRRQWAVVSEARPAAQPNWHYAYFPTRAQADQYAARLRQQNQAATVQLNRTRRQWEVRSLPRG